MIPTFTLPFSAIRHPSVSLAFYRDFIGVRRSSFVVLEGLFYQDSVLPRWLSPPAVSWVYCRGRNVGNSSAANNDSGTAHYDDATVYCRIAHPGGRKIADHHRCGAHSDCVRRADARSHISLTRRGQASNDDCGTAGRKNRTAYVRNDAGDHGTDVRIGNSGGWRHKRTLPAITLATCYPNGPSESILTEDVPTAVAQSLLTI